MRIYKFRAWDKENNEMIYENKFGSGEKENEGFIKLVEDCGSIFLISIYANGTCKYEEINGELQQFTGFHDKLGKEIYEGDIGLFDCAGGKIKSTIIWNDFVARYERDDIPYLAGGINGLCEVIGNIYEHKNLLDNTDIKV